MTPRAAARPRSSVSLFSGTFFPLFVRRSVAMPHASAAAIAFCACVRIGELSRDLEKAQGKRTSSIRVDEVPKAKALKAAGISRAAAHNYEQLAGGATPRWGIAGSLQAAADQNRATEN